MITVFEQDDLRVTWNQSSTFHLERQNLNGDWIQIDILTSYGVLGIEDAQSRAKWWLIRIESGLEEQKDVE